MIAHCGGCGDDRAVCCTIQMGTELRPYCVNCCPNRLAHKVDHGTVSVDDLREVIRTVLDCPSHFHKPDLKRAWTDKDSTIDFEQSQIVCEQCVRRMQIAVGG